MVQGLRLTFGLTFAFSSVGSLVPLMSHFSAVRGAQTGAGEEFGTRRIDSSFEEFYYRRKQKKEAGYEEYVRSVCQWA